jgi:DNA-binding response OmpR family regulator
MNILIISDDLKRGLFLKRGLQFENLNTNLIPAAEADYYFPAYSHYQSIILALNDVSKINTLYENYIKENKSIHFIILSAVFIQPVFDYAAAKSLKIFFSPFPLRIIANEIKQNFVSYNYGAERNYTIRDLELNVNAHSVKFMNKTIYLRNKEFNLLYYLMLNKGKILSRNMIIENVWDRNADIVTNTIEVHISNLRKKIDKKSLTKYIFTIPCTGYMLN